MPLRGHFQRLLPLISDLSRLGHRIHVFTHEQFRFEIERVGCHFVDLFSKYPLDSADDSSIPFASRYVSFAGKNVEGVLSDVKAYTPSLILYDTYAVIGRIIGSLLGLPHVNVCAGHNRIGLDAVEKRRRSHVAISESCDKAVQKLTDLGLEGVSPYYYLCATSPYLNIYCEPPEFLRPEERPPFEPIAFYGSVEAGRAPIKPISRWFPQSSKKKLRLLISFGTVVWFFHTLEAIASLRTLSRLVGELSWVEAIITLGGWPVDEQIISGLRRRNVRVESYVNQLEVLSEADLFITHHGLNSTHESIFHGVPMISYPFIADQPALAQRCQDFGLATQLTESPLDCVHPKDALAAINRICDDRHQFGIRLDEARQWELKVIAARKQVLQRVLDLTETSLARAVTN
jgi:MGT family glycosyltransferase